MTTTMETVPATTTNDDGASTPLLMMDTMTMMTPVLTASRAQTQRSQRVLRLLLLVKQ